MGAPLALSDLAVSADVQTFALQKGISGYLHALVELARRAFPLSPLEVSLARDAEDETHQYIAIDVAVGSKDAKELLEGQRTWSEGVPGLCPARDAVYFVLGWQ